MRPILFHVFGLPVHSYGVLLVSGFLVGLWRALRLCDIREKTEPLSSPRRISRNTIFDLGIIGLLVGLLGARIVYVVEEWSTYAHSPGEWLQFWSGGISLHGGLLFGILFMFSFCRKKRISPLAAGDICAPAWAIAYAIGRWGCLLNGCCYGNECDLPWAVRFPDERNPGIMTLPSHPTQIYASLFNVAFFAILLWWERRLRRDGEMFYGYIAMYGAYRFIVDFFRAGATSTYRIPALHITDTHLISIGMIVLGIAAIARLRSTRPAVQDARWAHAGPTSAATG